MISFRTIARNFVLIAVGILMLAVPAAIPTTTRIFGAALILWGVYMMFVFRKYIINCWRDFFAFRAYCLHNLILIVCGAILLIRPVSTVVIASILMAVYFLLGSVSRCRLMIFWRKEMSVPAFILRFAAIIATTVFAVLSIVMRTYPYLGLLLIFGGAEWVIGIATSAAFTSKLKGLISHIRLPKPKTRASKSEKSSYTPKREAPQYDVPKEYIYTDSFMDKSVD